MNEEEKKAIEYIEQFIGIEKQYKYKPIKIKTLTNTRPAIETILNLIEKQSKEIEELKKYEEGYKLLSYGLDNYTSNDKIREKIEELDIEIQCCEYADDDTEEYKKDIEKEKRRLLRDKKVLQSLLEKE